MDVAVPLVAHGRHSIRSCADAVSTGVSHSPPTNSSWPRCWDHVAVAREGARHGGQSSPGEGKASFVARRRRHPGVESAISMRWKVMAWTGCARRAGQASKHRGYLDPRSQPAPTRTLAAATGGVAVPSHARTTLSFGGLAVPILKYPSFPSLGTDSARPESEQENIIRTFGAPMGG